LEPPVEGNIAPRRDDLTQVSDENGFLTTPFIENEVKKYFYLEYNKTLGPNGLSVEFYQNFRISLIRPSRVV
jgi:hypothetical protein